MQHFLILSLILSAMLVNSGESLVLGQNPRTGEAVQTFTGDSSDNSYNPYNAVPAPAEPYDVKTVVNAPAVAINTRGILAPHIELLKLVEALLELKQNALTRLSALINDNSELIRSIIIILSSKISGLTTFALTGIAIFRRLLEFALELFSQWTITLPTISVGPSFPYAETVANPEHASYGLPSSEIIDFNGPRH